MARHTIDHRDAALEAVRRAIPSGTNQSVKKTLCSCLLMLAARRRIAAPVACFALGHYWHTVLLLLPR
jgi:hypothetical protein